MDRQALAKAVKEHLSPDFYHCEVVDVPPHLRVLFPGGFRLLSVCRREGRSIFAYMDLHDMLDADVPEHAPMLANGLVTSIELLLKNRAQ